MTTNSKAAMGQVASNFSPKHGLDLPLGISNKDHDNNAWVMRTTMTTAIGIRVVGPSNRYGIFRRAGVVSAIVIRLRGSLTLQCGEAIAKPLTDVAPPTIGSGAPGD